MDGYRDSSKLRTSPAGRFRLKILVTGGRGFLGKVLVHKLQDKGHIVLEVHLDLSQPACINAIRSFDFDFVFHLAGKTRLESDSNDPTSFYRANLDTARSLLECCRIKRVPLHYVSAYIYGNRGSSSICEATPPHPTTAYAHSKWMGEEICRFYSNFYSIPITISRPFNIYGPHQTTDFFIPRMIEQIQSAQAITPLQLETKRDYVFVEDAANALIAIMERGQSGHVYNVGSGISFSCKEVIEELQTLMKTCKPVFSHNRSEEIPHAQANIDKIRDEIGWEPTFSLTQGLAKCLPK